MSHNEQNASRPLSEISHLFLSSIREAAGNGQPRPQRTPPTFVPRPNVSMDLTPEEFAQVVGAGGDDLLAAPGHAQESDRIAPVTAVIGAHLSGRQFDRVKEYARHLAAPRKRIGLIEADASEFRLMCFDGTIGATSIVDGGEAPASETYDPRRMAEAIAELNWDVDRWLMFLPNPRMPEARALLREANDWVLLSTCDHDGVVSCYRTLKGLADTRSPADRLVARPRLSIGLLDAPDADSADRVYRKLASVCQQFLDWPLHDQILVRGGASVAEHLVVCCRPTRDKAQVAAAPQWQIIGDFLARAKAANPLPVDTDTSDEELHETPAADAQPELPEVPRAVSAALAAEEEPMRIAPTQTPQPAATEAAAQRLSAANTGDDVIDLAAGDAVLAAILRHRSGQWVECPIVPPMYAAAKLAVARDHHLVLIAEAGAGLGELQTIGRAYQWLVENRNLVAMALPQLSIDAHQMPQLCLLVDHADATAASLQPMLQGGNVSLETYRKLKWGGKTGLLLEAA